MIRIIAREVNTCPDGAVVDTQYRTFIYDLPELEEYLRQVGAYRCRAVIGVEIKSSNKNQK
jgi:hypothetical protein